MNNPKRVAALACFLLAACAKHEVAHPNVLLITLDTFRADRIGANTPALRKLASESVVFANAESAAPLTLPSHATILSGLLPLHHGLRNNGAGSFPKGRPTLATLFGGASYRTAAFVSAFILDRRFGLNRGFETYDDAIARDPNAPSQFEAERRGAETVDRALAWLHQSSDRPFFAWVHLYDAHAPYAPPAPYPQTYDGEIAYVDAQVARLLAAVDRSKTIVVVVGDHGESLGEHGELTHGLLLYEPTLHVPMLVSAPGVAPKTIREPVSTADLAPTIASIALHQTIAADGVALDLAREPAARDLYAESEYPLTFGWSDLGALRRGGMKLIASTHPELYDLAADPREQRNILDGDRRTYRSLADALTRLRATGAVNGGAPLVDAETKAKLASLGYVAPGDVPVAGPRPDPAAMAPLFRAFEEANWALLGGKRQQAIAELQSIVTRDPRNPVFRATLARALRQAGRLREAIPLYKEAVAIAPDDPEAWYNLAVALEEAGNAKEAETVIREAIRRDPSRPEPHNTLGIALFDERNARGAEEEFRAAIALDPRNARAWNNLGNVLRATNRLDDARGAYERALEIAPAYADALNGIGVVEVQQNRPQDAVAKFDAALRIAPDYYEAQLNRAIALKIAGNEPAARDQLQRLLASLPRDRRFDEQRRAAQILLHR